MDAELESAPQARAGLEPLGAGLAGVRGQAEMPVGHAGRGEMGLGCWEIPHVLSSGL